MTHPPQPTPDSNPAAAGNGFALDGAGVAVLDVDGVTKTYPGEPPVNALREVNLTIGQGERVAIARALVGRPAIVLADEPTGNLDQDTGQSILALIDQLHDAGSTIVVITHDHAIAQRMPRKVEILDGRIVADTGPAAGRDPRLRSLAGAPSHAQTARGPPLSEDPS